MMTRCGAPEYCAGTNAVSHPHSSLACLVSSQTGKSTKLRMGKCLSQSPANEDSAKKWHLAMSGFEDLMCALHLYCPPQALSKLPINFCSAAEISDVCVSFPVWLAGPSRKNHVLFNSSVGDYGCLFYFLHITCSIWNYLIYLLSDLSFWYHYKGDFRAQGLTLCGLLFSSTRNIPRP